MNIIKWIKAIKDIKRIMNYFKYFIIFIELFPNNFLFNSLVISLLRNIKNISWNFYRFCFNITSKFESGTFQLLKFLTV